MPKRKKNGPLTFDGQKIKKELLRRAWLISKRKRLTATQVARLVIYGEL